MGVGHGTYAPMAFTASLIALITNWGAITALLLAPLLWALYFLLIPRIRTRWMRITMTVAVLASHVLTGLWLAIADPAFARALGEEKGGLMFFGLLLALTMVSLLYFAARGVKQV